jgi:hypothetical protein
MSWFLLLILLQYITGIEIAPKLIILFIGIWYSSAHVINLSVYPNKEHRTHHVETGYNYGPSYMDFLFKTLKVDEGYTNDSQVINGAIIFTAFDLIKYAVASYMR